MKYILILIGLLFVRTLFAGGVVQVSCYPPDGTVWNYQLTTDERDVWNSSESDTPPMTPGVAKEKATEVMKSVPLGEKMGTWQLTEINLKKISSEPEHWIYMIHFDAQPDPKLCPWNGPLPWWEVIVRFDGSIPPPKIKLNNKK